MKAKEKVHLSQDMVHVAIELIMLSCNHRGQPLIADGGCIPKPPVVERTRGMKEPCSISRTHC